MINIICDFCNKEFKLKGKSYIKKHNFCSRECYHKFQSEFYRGDNHRLTKEKNRYSCAYCGKSIYMLESQVKNKKNIFCSKQCRFNYDKIHFAGEGNPNYRNGNIKIKCLNCNEIFVRPASQEGRAKYCSKACKDQHWSNVLSKTPENQERLKKQGANSLIKGKNKFTKPEMIILAFLESNSIYFIPQHPMYDRFVVDFYLPDYNIVIEVLGDYWHGNPIKIKYNKLTEKQIKNKEKDIFKENFLREKGHTVHMIWENDIYKNFRYVESILKL